jgi:hypothetical protein
MNLVRKNLVVKAVALLTGLLFLNMSFLLAEIALLKVSDSQVLENVTRLFLTGGLEEERDGDPQNEKDASLEDFIIPHPFICCQSLFSLLTKTTYSPEDLYPHANYSQTFSPPPDFI